MLAGPASATTRAGTGLLQSLGTSSACGPAPGVASSAFSTGPVAVAGAQRRPDRLGGVGERGELALRRLRDADPAAAQLGEVVALPLGERGGVGDRVLGRGGHGGLLAAGEPLPRGRRGDQRVDAVEQRVAGDVLREACRSRC